MRAIALGLALFAIGLATADQIVIKHVRPSRLLGSITGSEQEPRIAVRLVGGEGKGVLPPGITNITADDAKSILTIEGTPKAVEELRQIVELFDVVPRRISVRIIIQSPIDKYDSTTNTEINNNAPWKLRDDTTGVEVTMTPRINADGTVTGSIKIDAASKVTQVITRARNKESIRLRVSDDRTSVSQMLKDLNEYRASDLLITVTFSIKDEPKSPVKQR